MRMISSQGTIFRETIDEDVLICEKANVKILGTVNGNVYVLPNTCLTLDATGVVNGCIVATNALIELKPGCKVRKGFSWSGEQGKQQCNFAKCFIDTDNEALEKAILTHTQLLTKFAQSRA